MDISVTREGPVAVIRWDDGENRINHDSLGRLNEIVDELESIEGPLALVLTGTGKFFSNGLDLERFADYDELVGTVGVFCRLVGRLMVFPAYTVAAINGHAFAAGALLTCAFDHRIMREDRGYWCMNEAEIGLSLSEELWTILEHRLARATAVEAITTARRFAGPDALRWGIVEEVAGAEELVERGVAHAEAMARLDRPTLGRHKRLAHGTEATRLGFTI
jgi:enoyl-CoA hydratase/carnithine racemase